MYILLYIKENGVITLLRHPQRSRAYVLPIMSMTLILSLLVAPTESIVAAKTGLFLWFNTVLPSLLPFIIGANILMASNSFYLFDKIFRPIMKPLFNLPGCCAFPWIMGLVSGYPMGAKITAELRQNNQISDIETQRLLGFCNNSGPFFILGAVGVGMLQNEQLGYFLLLIHFISSVVTGIIFRFYRKNHRNIANTSLQLFTPTKSMGEILGTSITHSMEVIIQIGGYIIIFSVIGSLIKNTYVITLFARLLCFIFRPFGMSVELALSWLIGLIEMSNGVYMVSAVPASQNLKLAIISFLMAWGGLSIHAQSIHLLQDINIKTSIYLLGKLLHAVMAFLLTFLCLPMYQSHTEKLAPTFAISHYRYFSIASYGFLFLTFITILKIIRTPEKKVVPKG